MKDFIKLIGWLCLLPVLTGCSNDEDVSGTPEASDLPILVSLAQDKQSGSSRATIFEEGDDLKDVSKGGGNFHLNAYYLETGKAPQIYLNNAQVKYFPESEGAIPWLFFDAGKNDTYKAYWPKNGVLDFFAYMPYNAPAYISNPGYTQAGGPTFTASLPSAVNIDADATQEFIYAYRKEMTPQSELDAKKRVEMKFVHPFAVVYFELIQSKRLNPLATIEFQYIYHQGTFANATDTKNGTVTGGWGSYQDPKTNYTITINKKIPEDINFNTVFAGPFLVIPQSINGVNMKLKGTDAGGAAYESTPTPIYTEAVKSWLPGKKYTYSLKLEDPGEEILFNVKVEDWEIIEYDNIVNVE